MKQSGLIKRLWSRGQYLTYNNAYNKKLQHKTSVPIVLNLLGNFIDLQDKKLPVEFFFYTNAVEKAEGLAGALRRLGYEIYEADASDMGRNRFAVIGCTTKMEMSDTAMKDWAEHMCELGEEYDCEFDGWGTSPDM